MRCWVQLKADSQHRYCIPLNLYEEWLAHPRSWFAQAPQHPWRSTTPLLNHLHARSPKPNLSILVQIPRLIPFTKNSPPPYPGIIAALHLLECSRQSIHNILQRYDPLGLLRSLILNQRGPEALRWVRILGLVHLSSATGIHLYAVLWVSQRSFAGLWLTLRALCGRELGTTTLLTGALWTYRGLAGLIFLVLWMLAGGRAGMLRPVAIIAVRQLGRFAGIRWPLLGPLLLVWGGETLIAFSGRHSSALELGLAHSVQVFIAPNRWIYYLAVGGGLYWKLDGRSAHWAMALGSWITVAWLELLHSSAVALLTPILSILSVPLYCVVLYPTVLMTLLIFKLGSLLTPSVQSGFQQLAHLILSAVSYCSGPLLETVMKACVLPLNVWTIAQPHLPGAIFGAMTIQLLLHRLTRPQSFILHASWTLCISLGMRIIQMTMQHQKLHTNHPQTKSGHYAQSVEQLDVGQGDAALVLSENHVGFIDVGSESALTTSRWFEILSARGVAAVNWIALTHLDEDHAGGLGELMHLLPIDCVVSDQAEWTRQAGQTLRTKLATRGISVYHWQNAPSTCLPYPHLAPATELTSHANAHMGSILVPIRGGGFYFSAGDADALAEQRAAQWASQNAPPGTPRILKVTHHGSKASTTLPILKSLNPTQAWISVGSRNTYGHPSPIVLNLLNRFKIPISRTDQQGSIWFGG